MNNLLYLQKIFLHSRLVSAHSILLHTLIDGAENKFPNQQLPVFSGQKFLFVLLQDSGLRSTLPTAGDTPAPYPHERLTSTLISGIKGVEKTHTFVGVTGWN